MSSARNRTSELLDLLPSLLFGSLSSTFRTCGKPDCVCHKGERHGPYLHVSYRMDGRTRSYYVPAELHERVPLLVRATAGGRRARGQAADIVRYFVGRPAEPDGKPTLEQEVASEPDALVIAFKNDRRVYVVSEYRVTQRVEGGQVRLEKEPAAATQRVSTINAS